MTVVGGATAALQRVWNAEAALADGDLARGPRLRRGGRFDDNRLVLGVGADDSRPGGDRARVNQARPSATPTTR